MEGSRKILVPIDFGPCSRAAYRCAVYLSEDAVADIHVLHATAHVWPHAAAHLHEGAGRQPAPLDPGGIRSEHAAGATGTPAFGAEPERFLLRFLQGMPTAALARTQTYLAYGDVVRAITARASRDYELIVMGARGWSHTSADAVGPVARSVSVKAPCPVVTVWESVCDDPRGFSLMPPEEQRRQPVSERGCAEEALLARLRLASASDAVDLFDRNLATPAHSHSGTFAGRV